MVVTRQLSYFIKYYAISYRLLAPVQCDELAELEWLSNFVEESFSSVDTTHPPLLCLH